MGPCPVCAGEDTFEPYLDGFRLSGTQYEILRCKACGLGRTYPFLSEDEARSIYSSARYREESGKRFLAPVERVFTFLTRGRVKRALKYLRDKDKGRVLDVGCGRGDFLALMKERGFKAYGIEADERKSRYAPTLHLGDGVEVSTKPLSESGFKEETFDLITFWHSLEHMYEPAVELKEAARLLRPGGVMLVAVPNMESVQARICKTGWIHLDVPMHCFHFGLKNLEQLLERYGLQVVGRRHMSLEYNLFGFIQGLFNRLGVKKDLLYLLLRGKKAEGGGAGSTFLSVIWMILLSPLVLPLSVVLTFIEVLISRGGTIEVYARKRV